MIKLEHTYKSHMVIQLMRPNNQRAHRNFLIGETIEIEESEVSSELLHLARRGCVRMTKVIEVVETPITPIIEIEVVETPITEMDFETLEKELLR